MARPNREQSIKTLRLEIQGDLSQGDIELIVDFVMAHSGKS